MKETNAFHIEGIVVGVIVISEDTSIEPLGSASGTVRLSAWPSPRLKEP